MSVNRDRPHVLVLPEDDANRQLATGFHLEVDLARQRQMQVLPVAGGWMEVLNRFKTEHVDNMIRLPNRHLVLLVDFDNRQDRLDRIRRDVPPGISERVFVLGVWSRPEALKQKQASMGSLGSFETIGSALATDCRQGTDSTWKHEPLRHNLGELDRLNEHVRPILF